MATIVSASLQTSEDRDSDVPQQLQSLESSVDRTPTHSTRLCSTVCSLAERTRRAWLKSHGLQCHLCAPEKNLSSGLHMSHPLLLPHLPFTTSTPSSSLTLPSTTTQEHAAQPLQHGQIQEHQSIMHISMLSQSTSSAIKNHSGVKTCRVVETRARQLTQVMSPMSLRLSQGSKIFLEIYNNWLMHRKNLENKITEVRSPKK